MILYVGKAPSGRDRPAVVTRQGQPFRHVFGSDRSGRPIEWWDREKGHWSTDLAIHLLADAIGTGGEFLFLLPHFYTDFVVKLQPSFCIGSAEVQEWAEKFLPPEPILAREV